MDNKIYLSNYRIKYLEYKKRYHMSKDYDKYQNFKQIGGDRTGKCDICGRECNLIKISDNLYVCCLFLQNKQHNQNKPT